jgi:ribosome biogenesis GTPase
MPQLESLGWDPSRDAEFAAFRANGLVPGRVSLEHNHVYRVLTADGEVLAETAGRIKHQAEGRHELPVVGDWVALRTGGAGARATVAGILARRSWFSRKAAGRETEEQVIAANADAALVVFGLDKPVNQRAIERYLTLVRRSGAQPVVVLNKSDLLKPDEVTEAVAEATEVAGSLPVHALSNVSEPGVKVLEQYVAAGRTLVLMGPSGVGKSSIVNNLVGEERLPTGEVREWDQRGRHTSVHRELVLRAAGGLIIDTPGMRELQLWDAGEDLDATFDEIAALAGECRFRDCRHDAEPGCAVKAAVADGRVDAARYENYVKLSREQVDMEKLKDERALREQKRQAKVGSKALKAMQKDRGR